MRDATLGGYMGEHERPPAFAGADGESYTVEILTEPLSEPEEGTWGGYLIFLRWRDKEPVGHLESDYLATCRSESEVRETIARMTLHDIKSILDSLIENTTV